ncbi:MAG: amylo-alpha-1,6-glucosidase [Peptococcaceae bacterium]|nr:amylo-alpha-1,6-glucosidase [Peptococcaceae bacterium]
MNLGKGDWPTFEQGIQKEWLVTNGLGGYASSTVIGANTRKYHGLLVASLTPPVRRTLLLAKVDERIETGGRTYNLAANSTSRGVTEFGFIHLQRVLVGSFPTFIYSFADVFFEKTVFMVREKNTTVILYRIKNGSSPTAVRLVPLVNCRDFHWTSRFGQINFSPEPLAVPGGAGVSVKCAPGVPPLKILCLGESVFSPGEGWFWGMFYPGEQERGEQAEEDHFIPGEFVVSLGPGEEKVFSLLATIEEDFDRRRPSGGEPGEEMLAAERDRCRKLLESAGYNDDFARRLVVAADAFVVRRRSTGSGSVIAGYHWFNDWGRDAMIALPGLTLVTGRHGDAREILLTYARYCKNGLIPNMFQDDPRDPLYNTVDASLWYFYAVHKYLQYTGDFDFILERIYPVLKEIAGWYINGTHFNIGMDGDGLIRAGAPDLQLTWMDAKVDHWVVTPRNGKPVEISALWYNALKVLDQLALRAGEDPPHGGLAEKVRESFEEKFWYGRGGYFYDVIRDDERDTRMRPNQVIAMALPHSPVPPARARRALRRVWQELYATYGLRSLSCYHPEYRGVYAGDRVRRDGAYHQGTVWSWLIGPFVTAYRRAHGYSPASRDQAAVFLGPFRDHLRHHGVGYISEIFDGDEPVAPRGAIAQAWGVAEVLRAYVEDVLEIRPEYESQMSKAGKGG